MLTDTKKHPDFLTTRFGTPNFKKCHFCLIFNHSFVKRVKLSSHSFLAFRIYRPTRTKNTDRTRTEFQRPFHHRNQRVHGRDSHGEQLALFLTRHKLAQVRFRELCAAHTVHRKLKYKNVFQKCPWELEPPFGKCPQKPKHFQNESHSRQNSLQILCLPFSLGKECLGMDGIRDYGHCDQLTSKSYDLWPFWLPPTTTDEAPKINKENSSRPLTFLAWLLNFVARW